MSEGFHDILEPPAPSSVLGADQAFAGQRIPPQQQILLYEAGQWETFIHEWAHFSLKAKYMQVQRFSGAGDRGIDIAGFADEQKLNGVWDNYQCKHYGRGLQSGDVLPEIGKILWHAFNGEYRAPRRCFFVAPHGAGTILSGLLADAEKLKKAVIDKWNAQVRSKITSKQQIALEGKFLAYVKAFDFSMFDVKTGLQVIEDHQGCPYHVARFGGGLPPRPDAATPPPEIAAMESRYVGRLLEAYADHKKQPVPDIDALKAWRPLLEHFGRQREAFYQAESLRVFARDTVPPGTFEGLQENIYDGVIDIHDADHPDGYERVRRVTQAARELQITANVLITRTEPKDRDGICHQLANEDRLRWIKV